MQQISIYINERLKLNKDSKIAMKKIGFREFIKILSERGTKFGQYQNEV